MKRRAYGSRQCDSKDTTPRRKIFALRSDYDWRESVDSAYAALNMVCNRAVLVRFSLGGGLALDCASRNKDVAGVVAGWPPLRLQDFSSLVAPSLDIWNRMMTALHYQKGKREFVEIKPEYPDINYHRLPVAGLVALEKFMVELEEQLPNIKTPALIIQSQGDPVVDPEGSRLVFERLGSPPKEYSLFDIPRHGILLGEGSSKVYAAIGDFIELIRGTT